MDKKRFNSLIKKSMLSHGFEKVNTLDYCKMSEDGVTKIIIHAPNMIQGFMVAAQFSDYGKHTGKYIDSRVRNYSFELTLCNAASNEYSENEIVECVETVVDGIRKYLLFGKKAIRENIDDWVFGIFDHKERNDILICLGLDPIDPYSLTYLIENVELIKRGGFCSLSFDEYYAHKEYYDGYCEHGCKMLFDDTERRIKIYYDSALKV